MVWPAMIIPSSSACGSPSSSERFMNAPGSPSSALQMMYLVSPGASMQNCHFRDTGNPAPPRPRRPDRSSSSIRASRSRSSARCSPLYAPRAMLCRMSPGSITPQFRSTRRTCPFITGVSIRSGMPGIESGPIVANASSSGSSPPATYAAIFRAALILTDSNRTVAAPGRETVTSGSA